MFPQLDGLSYLLDERFEAKGTHRRRCGAPMERPNFRASADVSAGRVP